VRQVGYLQRNERFVYARKSESRIVRHSGILKYVFPVFDDDVISPFKLGPEHTVIENLEACNSSLCCNLTIGNFTTPAQKCLLVT